MINAICISPSPEFYCGDIHGFVAVPQIDDDVAVTKGSKTVILKVSRIIHRVKNGFPYIEVRLKCNSLNKEYEVLK